MRAPGVGPGAYPLTRASAGAGSPFGDMEAAVDDAGLARLIAGCARSDRDALAALFDEVGDLVYRMCLLVVREPRQAARCTAAAFVRIWIDARAYDPSVTSPRAWLATVAYLDVRGTTRTVRP